MGNDGGDIPKRKELVKQKAKVQTVSAESVARSRSRFCNLTNQRLKQPLAVCRLGFLYNYENILAALIQKLVPAKYAYIRKLTDIKKVQVIVTQIIIERAPPESENYISCPLTRLEFNGFNKFVALWTCGHVLSRKAMKEVSVESEDKARKCIICLQPYTEKDIIDLNGDITELEQKRKELLKKYAKKKQQKVEQQETLGQSIKKVKLQFPLNSLDKLDGEFRDVIRDRKKFKELFTKQEPNK